ncbi:MAG: phosphatidate cytidylyltransferase [Bacillota bacterium]
MLTRIISALIGAPIIMIFLVQRGIYLHFLILGLSLVGLYEFYKAVKNIEISTINTVGYIGTALYFVILLFDFNTSYIGLVVAFTIIAAFSYEIIVLKHGINGVFMTIVGVLYIPFLLSHIVYIDKLQYAGILVWLPFLAAWYTDSCAYFVGVSIGKKKLFPNISPNKSLEGYIGGLVGSTILCMITGIIINNFGYSIPLIHFIISGFLCALTSEIGDLAASYIKRFSGIKDFGSLIPGHGGILDRFDSILFTAPVIYYYFLIVQNMVK